MPAYEVSEHLCLTGPLVIANSSMASLRAMYNLNTINADGMIGYAVGGEARYSVVITSEFSIPFLKWLSPT